MTPTIQLDRDELTISFPEITHQLNAFLGKYMLNLPPELRLPEDRSELVKTVKKLAEGRGWALQPHREGSGSPLMSLEATASNLTAADVEKALRAIIHFPPPTVRIAFQRALRIPDDGKEYLLPGDLGNFPLRSVDDFADTLPAEWVKRGGVLMPMYQSEAMCIRFSSRYHFAITIASGKINAVSGEPWVPHLQENPQNYVLIPDQAWLDGFSVGEGPIRQFVAAPLGKGDPVEEPLTGKADIGGIQIQAYPVNAGMSFVRRLLTRPLKLEAILPQLFPDHLKDRSIQITRSPSRPPTRGGLLGGLLGGFLGMEGYTPEEIHESPYDIAIWDQTQTCRCFIHLCNSQIWKQFTHTNSPHPPMTAKEYKRSKIPWFDYYRDDQTPLKGSKKLAKLKSVNPFRKEKNTQPLPETIIQDGNTRRPVEIREFLDLP